MKFLTITLGQKHFYEISHNNFGKLSFDWFVCLFANLVSSPSPTCPGLDTDWPPARPVESRYEIRDTPNLIHLIFPSQLLSLEQKKLVTTIYCAQSDSTSHFLSYFYSAQNMWKMETPLVLDTFFPKLYPFLSSGPALPICNHLHLSWSSLVFFQKTIERLSN